MRENTDQKTPNTDTFYAVTVTTTFATHSTITSTKISRPFIENQTRKTILTGKISEKDYMQKEFQTNLLLLSHKLEDEVQTLITNWPGVSGIAGVLKDMLIPLSVL